MIQLGLKKVVDSPAWEWPKPAPAIPTALSAMTAGDDDVYIYYMLGNALYVYNTVTDGWMQAASAVGPTPATTLAIKYKKTGSYYGRAVAGGANTITGAFFYGKRLKGETIRIVAGAGAGQVRTITDVADPVAVDYMCCTTANGTTFTDSAKAYAFNAYAGYQVRIVAGTGIGQTRQILYNNATAVTVSDALYAHSAPMLPWGAVWAVNPATAAPASVAVIESCVATVDTPWATQPDNTSIFEVQSGSIWSMNSATAGDYSYFMKYCIAGDYWEQKTNPKGFLPAALGTDWCLERIGASVLDASRDSGTASSGSATTLADTAKTWVANRHVNRRVTITGGAGIGQQRTILSNTPTALTVARPWAVAPDNTSTYEIWPDGDKMYLHGSALAMLAQYSVEIDAWALARIRDFGICATLTATDASGVVIPIAESNGITRSGATATVTCAWPHGLKTGKSVTIAGAVQADYNITAAVTVTSATVFTYTVANSPATPATVTTGFSATVVVDGSKNWTINEHAGRLFYLPTQSTFQKITSNTAKTLTLSKAITQPTAAASGKYLIMDPKAFGGNDTGTLNTSGYGVPSAGSTTVLTDSSKAWTVNKFAGKTFRIIAGTGINQQTVVNSNTATALSYTAITTAPAADSMYAVFDDLPPGAGVALHWAYNTSDPLTCGRYIFRIRGGGTTTIDRYDIITETWDLMFTYPSGETYTTGTASVYDGGDRIYIQKDNTGRVYYYDVVQNLLVPAPQTPYLQSTVILGKRMEIIQSPDGAKFLYYMRNSDVIWYRTMLFG
jgi:hypothetical protein